jgi:hypothetical protein
MDTSLMLAEEELNWEGVLCLLLLSVDVSFKLVVEPILVS